MNFSTTLKMQFRSFFQLRFLLQVFNGTADDMKTKSLPSLYEYFEAGPNGISSGLKVEDRDWFELNGKKFRIFSGSLHYFRVHPAYWRDRLRKFRAAGLNAIDV